MTREVKILKTLVLASLLVAASGMAETPVLLRELVDTAGFSERDIRRLGDAALARELDVPDPRRSAAFAGIIAIKTDGTGLAAADPATVAMGADSFGTFRDPAGPADVDALRFPDNDIEVLADCQLERCKFKLSRAGIEDLSTIDWSSDDAAEEFTKRFQREALAYVQRYRLEGNRGLILYADKSESISLASTTESLVGQFAAFQRHAPALSRYLLSYPEGRSPSMSDSIVWAIKNFGYRPTLAIDHIVVDRDPKLSGAIALVAVKTIYANHYLAGRVQLGAILDGDVALGIPGHFIVLVDRIEFDDALSGFKRSLLSRGLLIDVRDRMKLLRGLADSTR